MRKGLFEESLTKVLHEISSKMDIDLSMNYKFKVVPIQEEGKTYNSKDDVMRLWIFSENNIKDKLLSFDTVLKLFSGLDPLYPLWINVVYRGMVEESHLIELQTSLRFRKPSQLQNQETGHAPFKVVYEK